MLRLTAWRDRARQFRRRASRPLRWLERGVTAALAAVCGLALGKILIGPKWTQPITAVGFALHIMLVLANPVLGLLTWMVTSPFARFTYQVVPMGSGIPDIDLDRMMIGLLIVLVMAQLTVGGRRGGRPGKVEFFGALYVLGMGLSVATTRMSRITAAQTWFDTYLIPLLLLIVARNLITNRHDLRSAMHTLLIIGLFLGLLATREQLTGDVWFYPPDRSVIYTADVRRVVGLLGNPAFIALAINLGVPFVAYLMATAQSRRRRLFYLACLAVMGLGVFMCYNRAGWVGYVLGLLITALFSPRLRKYLVPTAIAIGVIAAVAGTAILADPKIASRLFAQGPIEYRQNALNVAMAMLADHPWTGVGFSNYTYLYTRYAPWDVYLRAQPAPHNAYLNVAVTAGVPFALCYVLMFVCFFLHSARLYKKAGTNTFPDRTLIAATWGSLSAYLVGGLVMDTIIGLYPTMILFFIMGAVLGAWEGGVVPLSGVGLNAPEERR